MNGTQAPRWRVVIAVVGMAAVAVMLVATAVVGITGLHKPVIAGVGLVLTIAINRIYVVVARRGDVLEAIDIAEAPLVALALLLPAAEAVLVFGLGSLLLELALERAAVKKVLNVGVRVVGAALLLGPVVLSRELSASSAVQYAAAVGGAALYTLFTLLVVAVVVAEVAGERLLSQLPTRPGPRLLAWTGAVALGLSAAYVVPRTPVLLVGLLAPLPLMARTASVARRTQRDAERLDHVIRANSQILCEPTVQEQETVLLAAARSLLPWREVTMRDTPPYDDEHGALLSRDPDRWLVASPAPDSDPWSEEDSRIIEVLASRASVALDLAKLQSRLAEQALLDPLTQVANRRRLDEAMAELAEDPQAQYAVVVLDLDGFKTVNDRFGHDAGDELLRITAQRLVASVRAGDVVARTGGDEFIVLLKDLPSVTTAERIMRHIAERFDEPVRISRWQLPRIPVSIGLGVAPRDGTNGRDLIIAADTSMYDAKRARSRRARNITIDEIPLQSGSAEVRLP